MTHPDQPTFAPEQPPAQAVWSWRLLDAAGAEAEVAPADAGALQPRFTSQSDAETWLGETWRRLLDAGVEQVTLLRAEDEVYGPMSLRPAD